MEQFIKQLCVLILLQDLDTKAPSYIKEKVYFLGKNVDVLSAVGTLDNKNQAKLREYLDHWKVQLPDDLDELLRKNGV
jgi:hypothetical protein